MKTSLVNSVANESVLCLNCVETDGWFRFDPHGNDLPLLRSLLGRNLSLRFFHENRVSVLCGVTKIVSEVCARAFEDITTHILGHRNPIFVGSSSSRGVPPLVVAGGGGASGDLSVPYYPGIAVASNMGSGGLTGNVFCFICLCFMYFAKEKLNKNVVSILKNKWYLKLYIYIKRKSYIFIYA